MRLPISGLAAAGLLAAVPALAHASPYCDALRKAAAGAGFGFATVKGAAEPAAHAGAFDIYRTRLTLPGATACSVTVPHAAGLGPATYSCEFAGAVDIRRTMGRLARRTARCAGVRIGNPPALRTAPAGLVFGFDDAERRYDLSAAREKAKADVWTITLAIAPKPGRPLGPRT